MATKPYDNSPDEQPTDKVNDPAVAYKRTAQKTEEAKVDDVEALQAEAIRLVKLIDDPELLEDAIDELAQLVESVYYKRSPIKYTLEDRKKELEISQEQFKQGLGISHEEVLKRGPEWWISK